jgi:hypothetical protein
VDRKWIDRSIPADEPDVENRGCDHTLESERESDEPAGCDSTPVSLQTLACPWRVTGGRGLSSPPVRVVLMDMSRMTRELIRRILEEEQGIEVIGEVTDGTLPGRDLVPDAEADVIIVGTSAPDLVTRCLALLDGHAPRRVIAVSPDGRDAHLYGIRPYEAAVDEFSPEFVIEVVRDADSRLERVAT